MAPTPPPCSACNAQPIAICASCVRKRLGQHRTAKTTLQASLDRHVVRAGAALAGPGGLTEARLLEGEIATRQRSLDVLQAEVERLQSKLGTERARLAAQRSKLADRKAILATLESAPQATLSQALLELQIRTPDPYAPALLQTRQVLLSELLQVFNVRVYADDSDDDEDEDEEDDDFFKRSEGEENSPPLVPANAPGGRRRPGGGRGEWMISNGLIVPLPGDIHLYPAEQTNAALSATLHLLSLFATYLSPPSGLPFVPFLRPPSLQPSPRFSPSPLAGTPDLAALLARHSTRGVFPLQVPQRQPDLLLAGLAALQFNVAFLAAYVGVEIPLNESGLILFNLYRIALELASPLQARGTPSAPGGQARVEPVSLQRIALSLRGTLASSSAGDVGIGPSLANRPRSEQQRRVDAKDARRLAKDAAKATETAEERDERRARRRAKRAERDRRTRNRDDWELVAGDSLESIRRE